MSLPEGLREAAQEHPRMRGHLQSYDYSHVAVLKEHYRQILLYWWRGRADAVGP